MSPARQAFVGYETRSLPMPCRTYTLLSVESGQEVALRSPSCEQCGKRLRQKLQRVRLRFAICAERMPVLKVGWTLNRRNVVHEMKCCCAALCYAQAQRRPARWYQPRMCAKTEDIVWRNELN